MASYNELQFDWDIFLQNVRSSRNGSTVDLQLAAELGKTLLERNKELENLLRSNQRKCEDQKQEIEYLTKQNLALKEVNDSRMQIYETLDVSIRDLEIEKHGLMVQTSNDKKLIKSLRQNIEQLELRFEELTKQVEELTHTLEVEKKKNMRLRENTVKSPEATKQDFLFKTRHMSSASEPEIEEASTPTNPTKSFTNCGQNSSAQLPFMNFSQDFSSIQPVYSQDSMSHDSGFKTGCSSSGDQDEILKIMSELEDTKQQYVNEHLMVSELEHQLSVLSQENQSLQSRLVQASTIDEMKSVHEELSFLEEVRHGQMCTRCLKSVDCRMVPTENTSFIGTDDEDDRSLMELLNSASTHLNPPTYRSAVTIQDGDELSENDPKAQFQYNPYKDLVEKYERLLELQRISAGPKAQATRAASSEAPKSLHDELMTSGDFSSFNTKYTSDDAKKTATGERHKTPTDFSESETTSSGFSDETSTKATQTEDSNPTSFMFSIAEGEECKFSLNIHDEAVPIDNRTVPIDNRFKDRPQYRDLFKEIFSVLKKAAENKEDGEKLPLLDGEKVEEVAQDADNSCNESQADFDTQSIISSAISENSVAISECITKTERRKAKSHKKQAAKDELENKPPSAVQMVAGKLVTPYNRIALDFAAINAKKKARRSRYRSKDKYAGGGRDSSVCSNASSITSQDMAFINESAEEGETSTLTRNKKGMRFDETSKIPESVWNGNSMTVYNQTKATSKSSYYCRPNVLNTDEVEFKKSAASHELKKLKKLDLSYAEVLRQADRRQRRRK